MWEREGAQDSNFSFHLPTEHSSLEQSLAIRQKTIPHSNEAFCIPNSSDNSLRPWVNEPSVLAFAARFISKQKEKKGKLTWTGEDGRVASLPHCSRPPLDVTNWNTSEEFISRLIHSLNNGKIPLCFSKISAHHTHRTDPIPLDIMERDCPRSCFQLLECILHLGKQERMSFSTRADVQTQILSWSEGHLFTNEAARWGEGRPLLPCIRRTTCCGSSKHGSPRPPLESQKGWSSIQAGRHVSSQRHCRHPAMGLALCGDLHL